MKEGILGYNYDEDRFGVLNNMDLWEDSGLHCGAHLEVLIDNEWIADRLELSTRDGWYLVNCKLSGDSLEGLKVRNW